MGVGAKQRIIISTRLNGAGGVETHLFKLSRVLAGRGAEVTIASRVVNPSTPLVDVCRTIPVKIVKTPFAGKRRYFRLSTAWALVFWPTVFLRGRFDVLYTFEFSSFTRFLSYFVKPRGKVIGNCVGDLTKAAPWLGKRINACVSELIVESSPQKTVITQNCKLKVPVRVIPLLGHYQASVATHTPEHEKFEVAFLGRYERAKGIYRLLDIWSDLGVEGASLHFYGGGPERDRLEREIRVRGLHSSVDIHGGWNEEGELSAILQRTDLVVLPSEAEGLPVVLLEAMAYGVPFVASDVGAVRTLAQDNPDVRVVPLDNFALRKAILEMMRVIREGRVSRKRLQAYHRGRYPFERIADAWAISLLGSVSAQSSGCDTLEQIW
jgi:glycosyltransferase involved in cell wall biosynthesis